MKADRPRLISQRIEVADFVVSPTKIVAYLLDEDHEDGGSKAKFFRRRGFNPDNTFVFMDALFEHATSTSVEMSFVSRNGGMHLICEGPLTTPDGRDPDVRVVWRQEQAGGEARFISAYPLKRRRGTAQDESSILPRLPPRSG